MDGLVEHFLFRTCSYYTAEHKKWDTGKKLSKYLSGKEGAIMSTYNIKTEELLNLMKEYKRMNTKSGTQTNMES